MTGLLNEWLMVATEANAHQKQADERRSEAGELAARIGRIAFPGAGKDVAEVETFVEADGALYRVSRRLDNGEFECINAKFKYAIERVPFVSQTVERHELIVLATNCHADLLAACQAARGEIADLLDDLTDEGPEADVSAQRTLATMDAAIGKAAGGR